MVHAYESDYCPACSGPFDEVKRDLAAVSRILSVQLPAEAMAALSKELAMVKLGALRWL